ncbi:MAG: ketopantoate reductase family protein, partial [Candidatus Promineifilaceae bacterium]
MMRILVYGAGAIGGYLGARLLHSGHEVVMLDRLDMVDAINQEGIIVDEAGEQIHVRPAAVGSLADAMRLGSRFDLILMGLKSYDLPAALMELAAHDGVGETFLTVQNGIGIEEPFVDQFGAKRVVAGSLTTPVSKRSPLHLVVERSDRGLGLAPTQAGAAIKPWIDMFQQAGIDTAGMSNY